RLAGYSPGERFELLALPAVRNAARPDSRIFRHDAEDLRGAVVWANGHTGVRNLYLGSNPVAPWFTEVEGASGARPAQADACPVSLLVLDGDPTDDDGDGGKSAAHRAAARELIEEVGRF